MEEIEGVVNSEYQEIKLENFRYVICFSVFFFSFFGRKFYYTGHFFGIKQIKQQKIKIRQQHLNEYNYRLQWVKQYKWRTI